MKLFSFLLISVFCSVAHAIIGPFDIVIQPVQGNPSLFALTASGSSTVAPGSATLSGAIWTDSNFMTTIEEGASGGLGFGGESVTTIRNGSLPNASLEFVIDNTIPGGSFYSFDGGTAFGSVSSGSTFAETFTVGSYTITDVFGMFGQSFSGNFGTLVVDNTPLAVPEPGTYAALIGLFTLGIVAWRRQRS